MLFVKVLLHFSLSLFVSLLHFSLTLVLLLLHFSLTLFISSLHLSLMLVLLLLHFSLKLVISLFHFSLLLFISSFHLPLTLFISLLNPRLLLLHLSESLLMLPGLLGSVTFRLLSLLCQLRHEVLILYFHARYYPFDCRFHLRILRVDTVIHELGKVKVCQSCLFFFSGYY